MFRELMTRLLPTFRLRRRGLSLHGIHSEESFKSVVDREIARSDRNSHEFSLVAVRFEKPDFSASPFGSLLRVHARRSRFTDEIGWLDAASIGILLPDTGSTGARKFAADMKDRLASIETPSFDCEVYTYPSQSIPGSSGYSANGNGHLKQLTFFDSTDEPIKSVPVSRPLPLWKRAMDIVGSLSLLLFFFPLILLMIIVVKTVSRGPAFIKQERIGVSGEPFGFWKMRTMSVNPDTSKHREYVTRFISQSGGCQADEAMTKLDDEDSNIIPFGRILRESGLDELPQLLNVLRGEMSLVGPRPCLRYEYEAYRLWQTRRFDIVPGMTGLWQVSGKNRTTFNEMMRLDIRYGRIVTFLVDVKILLLTGPAILGQIFHLRFNRAATD